MQQEQQQQATAVWGVSPEGKSPDSGLKKGNKKGNIICTVGFKIRQLAIHSTVLSQSCLHIIIIMLTLLLETQLLDKESSFSKSQSHNYTIEYHCVDILLTVR